MIEESLKYSGSTHLQWNSETCINILTSFTLLYALNSKSVHIWLVERLYPKDSKSCFRRTQHLPYIITRGTGLQIWLEEKKLSRPCKRIPKQTVLSVKDSRQRAGRKELTWHLRLLNIPSHKNWNESFLLSLEQVWNITVSSSKPCDNGQGW